jgi:hypothetical protein
MSGQARTTAVLERSPNLGFRHPQAQPGEQQPVARPYSGRPTCRRRTDNSCRNRRISNSFERSPRPSGTTNSNSRHTSTYTNDMAKKRPPKDGPSTLPRHQPRTLQHSARSGLCTHGFSGPWLIPRQCASARIPPSHARTAPMASPLPRSYAPLTRWRASSSDYQDSQVARYSATSCVGEWKTASMLLPSSWVTDVGAGLGPGVRLAGPISRRGRRWSVWARGWLGLVVSAWVAVGRMRRRVRARLR